MLAWLKRRIIDVVSWFGDLFVELFEALWDLITDVLVWFVDGLLGLVVAALDAIDLSLFDGVEANWGDLPGEIINVLGLLGVGEASALISAAILVRIGLQFIPFTRLGS